MLDLQVLTTNGEIISYPLTRVGIYNLAKNLLQHDQAQFMWYVGSTERLNEKTPMLTRLAGIVRWARNNMETRTQEKIRRLSTEVANSIANKIGAYCNWDRYCVLELCLENYKRWTTCAYYSGCDCLRPLDQIAKIGHHLMPIKYKEAIKYDKEYRKIYIDLSLVDNQFAKRVPDSIAGYGDKCHDHIVDDDVMFRCYYCGTYHEGSEKYYVENEDDYICEDCYDSGHFLICHNCGDIYDPDIDYDGRYSTEGDWYCCEGCANADGFYYVNDDGEFCEDDPDCDSDNDDWSSCIGDYHQSKSYFSSTDYFIGKMRKNQSRELTTGIEFESEGDLSDELFSFIKDKLGKIDINQTIYSIEHDGSLGRGGFELVTQKMTRDGFNKVFFPRFKEVMNYMRRHGRHSHDGGNCGLHIHVSRDFFGDGRSEQYDNAKKVMSFMEHFRDEFETISRRKNFGYCDFFNEEITKDSDIFELCDDRYHIFNIKTNIPTFEFRLFRGTLNEKSFEASYDICCTLAQNAKRISWKNVWNPACWFKGLSKVGKEYLASKNVFAGAY